MVKNYVMQLHMREQRKLGMNNVENFCPKSRLLAATSIS